MVRIIGALLVVVTVGTSPLHAEGFLNRLRNKLRASSGEAVIKIREPEMVPPKGVELPFWHLILTNGAQIVDTGCKINIQENALACKHGIYSRSAYSSVRMITNDDPEYPEMRKRFWETH